MTMAWTPRRRRGTATPDRWTDVGERMVGIERRIEQLGLVCSETPAFVQVAKDGDRWVRTTPFHEAGRNTGPDATAAVARMPVTSLAQEVADFVATYLTIAKVVVRGLSPEELVEWIEPFLDQDQDQIIVSGQVFEVYPWAGPR